MRSLITLKALTYQPTGGIAAAATTSLPEQLGGPRNWDYRFCWLRDTTFTLLAQMNAGYYEEAKAWREWLLRAVGGDPSQVQIMYGLAGERRLSEWEAQWLAGYEGAKPVRIGNAASEQMQIDIYGEVMDALHQARTRKLAANEAGWTLQQELLEHLETIWANRIRAFGKYGVTQDNSHIQRSWPGSPLTAASRALNSSLFEVRSIDGVPYARRFTTRSAKKRSTVLSVPLYKATAPSNSTLAFCSFHLLGSFLQVTPGSVPRSRLLNATLWWTVWYSVMTPKQAAMALAGVREHSWLAAFGLQTILSL